MAAAALVTGGCIDRAPVSPSADDLIVHAVLDAGAADQYVIVQATNGSLAGATGVEGAIVTLELPEGRTLMANEERDSTRLVTMYFEQHVRSVYHFALAKSGVTIAPGRTYALRVVTPNGRSVYGHTTVPAAVPVALATVQDSFRLRGDTLAMEWQRVPAARSYEVSVKAASRGSPVTFFADTSARLFGSMTSSDGQQLFLRGSDHQIIVSAVDSNYYDYYRRGTDFFTGVSVIGRLDGALGVFGSIVELRTKRVVAY